TRHVVSLLERPADASRFHHPAPGHHGELRSFPTRRSSDLQRRQQNSYENSDNADHHQKLNQGERPAADGNIVPHDNLESDACVRSEEHTSELQSRENLVCRLLLEKKKNPSRTPKARPA